MMQVFYPLLLGTVVLTHMFTSAQLWEGHNNTGADHRDYWKKGKTLIIHVPDKHSVEHSEGIILLLFAFESSVRAMCGTATNDQI